MSSVSLARYAASSISPLSRASCSSMSSCLIAVSSVSSSRAVRSTISSDHRMPATGPETGNVSSFASSPMRPLVRALELELDVDEVVRRPRTGVLERQQAFVAVAQLAHLFVEQFARRAFHEEGGVHDHAIADRFAAAARDGHRAQRFVHVDHERVAGFLERRLDEPAYLNTGVIRGAQRVVR